MKRFLFAALAALALATPMSADVTITGSVSMKMLDVTKDSASRICIKGTKMRADTKTGTEEVSTILDASANQMIFLTHATKTAEIYDLTKIGGGVEKKAGTAEVKVSLTPTGETRRLLGRACAGYALKMAIPISTGNDAVNMVMSGPVWVAKASPGTSDYATFYKAASARGLLFSSPQQLGQLAQARGMAEMYRALAQSGGVPYAQELQVSYEGNGPMAGMMNQTGGMNMATTVTAISTDPIADDTFTVPAGYTTKNK